MPQLDRWQRQANNNNNNNNNNTSLPSRLRMLATEGSAGLQKLLKRELRMTIMAKRHARGQGELKVDFPEPKVHELTLAELERRERRREQNRRAAQRCRRKKRMNQMSVIQNYEWIVTRNQTLEQELERLRQEKQQLQSLLKAHCQVCTCPHALTLLPHVQGDTPTRPLKMDPGEEEEELPQASSAGFVAGGAGAVVSRASSNKSWQFESAEGMLTPSVGQPGYSNNNIHNHHLPQPGSYPSTPFSSPSPTTSTTTGDYHAHNDLHNASSSSSSPSFVSGSSTEPLSSVTMQGSVGVGGPQPLYSTGSSLTKLASALPPIGLHVPQGPGAPSALNLLDELTFLPGGLRPCVFFHEDEAATPLSADGRRSISSVSSDVSSNTLSEQPGGAGCCDVTGGPHDEDPGVGLPAVEDFYVTDDVTTDVSQLLSQINQSDLLFQQEDCGGLEEVFSESAVAINTQHFLHTL
ncbi:uncharacterized protein LOC143280915 [Babylonia areolata]|uniref:uncharacterized protein LOC143280915 n=1 Tax=Babylonia areolata TaxID=304850 RepID=UPI003FCF8D79